MKLQVLAFRVAVSILVSKLAVFLVTPLLLAGFHPTGDRSNWVVLVIESALLMAMSGTTIYFWAVKPLYLARAHSERLYRIKKQQQKDAERVAKVGSWEQDWRTNSLHWTNETNRIFEVERPVYREFEKSREAFLKMVHHEDRDEVRQLYKHLQKTGDTYNHVHRIVTRSGRTKWIRERCVTEVAADGSLIKSTGTVQDITARRTAELEIARLKSTLDLTKDAVFMFWPGSFEFFYLNQSAMDQVGWSKEECEGKTASDVASYFDPERFRMLTKPLVDGLIEEICVETLSMKMDPIELTIQYIDPKDESPRFILITRDISDRKAAEKAKAEFIATVSHELRTPLTAIMGGIGLLKNGVGGKMTKEAQKLLDIADKNSNQLLSLVNDILLVEKLESKELDFNMERVDLAELVADSIEMNRSYGLNRQIKLSGPDCDEPVWVEGDRDRLLQVMANLLSNAAKFSNPGGRVEVSIETGPRDVKVFVRDYGVGIPKDQKRRIFEKFCQVDSTDSRRNGGIGLGLSIAKLVVRKHGGKIGFDSVPGEGATFHFSLKGLVEEQAKIRAVA